jgi:hypothetical protein
MTEGVDAVEEFESALDPVIADKVSDFSALKEASFEAVAPNSTTFRGEYYLFY